MFRVIEFGIVFSFEKASMRKVVFLSNNLINFRVATRAFRISLL